MEYNLQIWGNALLRESEIRKKVDFMQWVPGMLIRIGGLLNEKEVNRVKCSKSYMLVLHNYHASLVVGARS